MATATVAGFTTPDIHTAADEAGDGGEVIFPVGEYDSLELVVSIPNQTWRLDRNAIIKRNATATGPLISVQADGWKLRGGTLDGNRANGQTAASGVVGVSHGVDMEDFDLVGVAQWGIYISDAPMFLRRFSVRKSGLAGVFWLISENGDSRDGPVIEHGNIDRSLPADYISSGGILIQSQNTGRRVLAPKLLYTKVSLPVGTAYSAVGVEFLYTLYGVMIGNNLHGGRIGYSLGKSTYTAIQGNFAEKCSSYHIELAQASGANTVTGNMIQGATGSTGVENSGISCWNTIVGNTILGCTTKVRIATDSYGCVVLAS